MKARRWTQVVMLVGLILSFAAFAPTAQADTSKPKPDYAALEKYRITDPVKIADLDRLYEAPPTTAPTTNNYYESWWYIGRYCSYGAWAYISASGLIRSTFYNTSGYLISYGYYDLGWGAQGYAVNYGSNAYGWYILTAYNGSGNMYGVGCL